MMQLGRVKKGTMGDPVATKMPTPRNGDRGYISWRIDWRRARARLSGNSD